MKSLIYRRDVPPECLYQPGFWNYNQSVKILNSYSKSATHRDVLIEAARLRANVNIKLPDAIHAATALLTQCSTFVTNDRRFQNVLGLLSQISSL
jgi:predicted nucleic acid-binding protein